MRPLLALLMCLMLAVTAWSSAAQAERGIGCSEIAEQVAVHAAGDCDEVPADADKDYPHCHTGCHGHHVAAPISSGTPRRIPEIGGAYAPTPEVTPIAHRIVPTLRPPQA